MSNQTELRFVYSEDPEKIVLWVTSLPFKIEIKSGPVVYKDKFYLFFILKDKIEKKNTPLLGGNLDG